MYFLSSPRARTLRDVERRLGLDEKAKKERVRDGFKADPEPLLKGEMRLYSYYAPSLVAGPTYSISVAQSVPYPGDAPDFEKPDLLNSVPQKFNVSAPRFALQPSDIHSTYPPQGHADVNSVCPHIIFNDPHMPWLRYPLPSLDSKVPDFSRNRIPWFALLVFELPELTLPSEAWNSLFPTDTPVTTETASTTLPLKDVMTSDNVVKPSLQLSNEELLASVTVICPPVSTLSQLICGYDSNFKPITTGPTDLSRYKYFVHVRDVNTRGMADAGVEDEGVFSVAVSHRTGPPRITAPTPVVVHLVSLEGWSGLSLPPPSSPQRAAMISLYSWTYQCLPPLQVNFVESMRNLGRQSQSLLRPTADFIKSTIPSLVPRSSAVRRLSERLQNGYSLLRYRTQTGEPTVAYTRGPFAPVQVPCPISSAFPTTSNFGTDREILDPETGIMDISYSAAWQLGKTMALADKSFCTALARLRSSIVTHSLTTARTKAFETAGVYNNRAALLSNDPLFNTIDALSRLQNPDMKKRWHHTTVPRPRVSLTDEPFLSSFRSIVTTTTVQKTGSLTGEPYNEFNAPLSDDWATVMGWLLDRMFFGGVPAHYLLTEPSFLPPESLRFFYIDDNWVKSLVDGALSLANHIEKDDDSVRVSLRDALDTYLKTELTDGVVPQVPKFGFLMRSKVVSAFPSMTVTAPFINPPPSEQKKSDVLRLEVIDKDTMLCLFDRIPDKDSTAFSLIFTQPPHQQCFSLGYNLTSTELGIEFQKIFNDGSTNKWGAFDAMTYTPGGTEKLAIYDWESKLINQPAYLKTVIDLLSSPIMNGGYQDPTLMQYGSSSLFGLQLSDPIYQLILSPPLPPPPNRSVEHKTEAPSPSTYENAPVPKPMTKATDPPHAAIKPTRIPLSSRPAVRPRQVVRNANPFLSALRTPAKRVTPQFLPPGAIPPPRAPLPTSIAATTNIANTSPTLDQLLFMSIYPATDVNNQVFTITNTPIDVIFHIKATPAVLPFDVQLISLGAFPFPFVGEDVIQPPSGDPLLCLFSDISSGSIDMLDNKRWLLTYSLSETALASSDPPLPNTWRLNLSLQPRDQKKNYVIMDPTTELNILAKNVVINPTPEIVPFSFILDYKIRDKSNPTGIWAEGAQFLTTQVEKVLPQTNASATART